MAYARDPRKLARCSSDEESEEEGRCSDDNSGATPPKMTCTTSVVGGAGKKKNNIWSDLLQDESLADSMKTTVVNAGERVIQRGPESFGMTSHELETVNRSKKKNLEDAEKTALDQEMDVLKTEPSADPFGDDHPDDPVPNLEKKPTHSGNGKRRSEQKGDKGHNSGGKRGDYRGAKAGSNSRKRFTTHPTNIIKKISIPADSTAESAGSKIARALGEPKTDLMIRVAQVLGVSEAIKLYSRTYDQEMKGGLQIFDGSRRRTPGGVMLFYVRENATKDQVAKIFEAEKDHERKRAVVHRKQRREDQFVNDLQIMKRKIEEEKKKRVEAEKRGEKKGEENKIDVDGSDFSKPEKKEISLEDMDTLLAPPPGMDDLEIPD